MTSLLLLSMMSSNLKLLFVLLISNMLEVECGRQGYAPLSRRQDVSIPQEPIAEVTPRRKAPDVNCIDQCDLLLMKKVSTTGMFNRDREIMEAGNRKEQTVDMKAAKGSASPPVGSKPPSCVLKCGHCKPCVAVRVPIQPGTPNASEYFPEAWRCKCGGKLYLP